MTTCPLSWTTHVWWNFQFTLWLRLFQFQCHRLTWLMIYSPAVTLCWIFFFQWYQAKFAAIIEKFGREIRVFQTPALSPSSNEVSNSGMQCFKFYIFFLMPKYALSLISYLSGQLCFRTPAKEIFLNVIMMIFFIIFFLDVLWQRRQMTSMSSLPRIIIEF